MAIHINIITPSAVVNPVFLALELSYGKPHFDLAKRAQGKSVVHRRADWQLVAFAIAGTRIAACSAIANASRHGSVPHGVVNVLDQVRAPVVEPL